MAWERAVPCSAMQEAKVDAGREMAEQGILTHRQESPVGRNKNNECVVQILIWKGPEGSEESHKFQGVECSTQGATFYQKMQG